VSHRGCESNLSEDRSAISINIATWNVKRMHQYIGILGVAETHWTNDTPEAFEYNDHVIIY